MSADGPLVVRDVTDVPAEPRSLEVTALLATLGTRLLGSARPGDLVARLGGDEFVVGACVPRAALPRVEQRIRDAGCFVLSTTDGALPVRCSTGIATSDDAADPAALLSLSDAGMYRDKALARA